MFTVLQAYAINLVTRLRRDERGLTGVEYAIMLVFLAMVIAIGAFFLGNSVSNLFTHVGGSLGGASLPPLP